MRRLWMTLKATYAGKLPDLLLGLEGKHGGVLLGPISI